jgi:hypothetical protein
VYIYTGLQDGDKPRYVFQFDDDMGKAGDIEGAELEGLKKPWTR